MVPSIRPEDGPEGMAATAAQLAMTAIRLTGTAIELVTRNPAATSAELVMIGTSLRELRAVIAAGLVDVEALTATFWSGWDACEQAQARERAPRQEPRGRPLKAV